MDIEDFGHDEIATKLYDKNMAGSKKKRVVGEDIKFSRSNKQACRDAWKGFERSCEMTICVSGIIGPFDLMAKKDNKEEEEVEVMEVVNRGDALAAA